MTLSLLARMVCVKTFAPPSNTGEAFSAGSLKPAASSGTLLQGGPLDGLQIGTLPPMRIVSVIGSPTFTLVGAAEAAIVYCPTRP